MYYFDNAATSWPKPASVINKAVNCIQKHGANSNRGGYTMAREAGNIVLSCRKKLCDFFNTADPFEYIFTHNTTYALNLAIKGFVQSGMHVVTTSLEHNSVLRPLHRLKNSLIELDIVNCDNSAVISPSSVAAALRRDTKLLVITHVSNVTGTVQPIEEIIEIAHKNGTSVLLDAAQSAGCLPLDIASLNVDMVAMPAHKGLFGLQGLGVLYVKNSIKLTPLIEGGTGSESKVLFQPDIMPDKLEAGTLNTPAIAALSEALDFLHSKGVSAVSKHDKTLAEYLYSELSKMENIHLYGSSDLSERTGIVTFNVGNSDPGVIEEILDKRYSIAVRSGFHCAPLAHRSIGTYETGAIRFSFGYYNDEKQIDHALQAIKNISIRF